MVPPVLLLSSLPVSNVKIVPLITATAPDSAPDGMSAALTDTVNCVASAAVICASVMLNGLLDDVVPFVQPVTVTWKPAPAVVEPGMPWFVQMTSEDVGSFVVP